MGYWPSGKDDNLFFPLSRCIYTKHGENIENGKGISHAKRVVDSQSQGAVARAGAGGVCGFIITHCAPRKRIGNGFGDIWLSIEAPIIAGHKTAGGIPKRWGRQNWRSFWRIWPWPGTWRPTQNQALNALVFLYEQVVQQPLGDLGEFARVKRPARLPVVLTQEETQRVLAALKPGTGSLIIRFCLGQGCASLSACD